MSNTAARARAGGVAGNDRHFERSQYTAPTDSTQHLSSARELTRRLGGRWHGASGSASCPVCQPERRRNQNALAIAVGVGGALLLHCFRSGCGYHEILAASGLSPGGYTPPDRAETARRERAVTAAAAARSALAERLWQESEPITGTIAERYLRHRGIRIDLPGGLRFHPRCFHGPSRQHLPAMLARVSGGAMPALHRTFLALDGRGKALVRPSRMALGAIQGAAVRLAAGAGPLLVGEGIESTLSAWILLENSTASAWAALSASGLRGLRLPARAGRLIIATDGDAPGRDAAHALAARAHALSWLTALADPGDRLDWNDRLQLVEIGQKT